MTRLTEYFFVKCYESYFLGGWGGADGRDDFPVCRLCLKEVSRTGQDPSAGTTLPCKSENKQTNNKPFTTDIQTPEQRRGSNGVVVKCIYFNMVGQYSQHILCVYIY